LHPGRGFEEAQEVELAFMEKDGGAIVRLTLPELITDQVVFQG